MYSILMPRCCGDEQKLWTSSLISGRGIVYQLSKTAWVCQLPFQVLPFSNATRVEGTTLRAMTGGLIVTFRSMGEIFRDLVACFLGGSSETNSGSLPDRYRTGQAR